MLVHAHALPHANYQGHGLTTGRAGGRALKRRSEHGEAHSERKRDVFNDLKDKETTRNSTIGGDQ